jgi:anti-anti-sigma factor
MEITEKHIDDVAVMLVNGRIDTNSAHDFETAVMKMLDTDCKKLIIDCCELNYISSSGLRVFLIALKRISAVGGKLILCGLQTRIQEVFDIAGFSMLFTLATDEEEALTRF